MKVRLKKWRVFSPHFTYHPILKAKQKTAQMSGFSLIIKRQKLS